MRISLNTLQQLAAAGDKNAQAVLRGFASKLGQVPLKPAPVVSRGVIRQEWSL